MMRVCLLLPVFCLLGCAGPVRDSSASAPVFQVDVPYATKDKPQSKLWFAHGSWWAWLPVPGGSAVWRRTEAGWQRQTPLDQALRGLPGQADVWAEPDTVRAVLAEPGRLAVTGFEWDAASNGYKPAADAVQFAMPQEEGEGGAVETATIARDGRGRWWIAYNWKRSMWVRRSLDRAGAEWSQPVAVNESPAEEDDLCAIVALPGSVGVVWSDQAQDAIWFRRHEDGAPGETWMKAEVAESGGRTADDHIHTAVAGDGRLYVATKNSVDRNGRAQLVLRIRDPQGMWTNHPYAARTASSEPSRPIVLLGGDPARLLLFHTVYRSDRRGLIAWQTADPSLIKLDGPAGPLMKAAIRLNDVTGSKARLPDGQPWIVLASDGKGRIYEARIDQAQEPAAVLDTP